MKPIKTARGWEIAYDGTLNAEQDSDVYATKESAREAIIEARCSEGAENRIHMAQCGDVSPFSY